MKNLHDIAMYPAPATFRTIFFTLIVLAAGMGCDGTVNSSNTDSNADAEFVDDVGDVTIDHDMSDTLPDVRHFDMDHIADAGDAGNLNDAGGGTPQDALLHGFRILEGEPTRIYFDSTRMLTAASHAGFDVHEKSIDSVTISADGLNDHFFTVSEPFTYWDNHAIRYEGDDVSTDQGTLPPFTLRHIENNLSVDEGTNGEFFVDAAAAGGGDGSQGSPFRTLQAALDALPSGGGFKIWVKAGRYTEGELQSGPTGRIDLPNVVEGYRETPGDITEMYYTYDTANRDRVLDSNKMPLFDGGNRDVGQFYDLANDSYTIWRNLQITGYQTGFRSASIHGFVAERILMKDIGPLAYDGYAGGTGFKLESATAASTRQRIQDSLLINITGAGIVMSGQHGLILDTKIYCNEAVAGAGDVESTTDYYFSIHGSHNIIRRSVAYKDTPNLDGHSGHGFALKAAGRDTEYNLVTECLAVGIFGSFQARHPQVRFNVFRASEAHAAIPNRTNINRGYGDTGGIELFSGGEGNIFEDLYIHDVDWAINFSQNREVRNGITQRDAIIRNNVFERIWVGVWARSATNEPPTRAVNNRFVHNLFSDVEYLFRARDGADRFAFEATTMRNNVFTNIRHYEDPEHQPMEGWNFEHNVFHETPFAMPDGPGNLSGDPGFVDAANSDYHLQPDSICIDAAISTEDVLSDRDGRARPQGSAPDIGPYEH